MMSHVASFVGFHVSCCRGLQDLFQVVHSWDGKQCFDCPKFEESTVFHFQIIGPNRPLTALDVVAMYHALSYMFIHSHACSLSFESFTILVLLHALQNCYFWEANEYNFV